MAWSPITISSGANVEPSAIAVADINVDGLPDVVVGYGGTTGSTPEIVIFFQTTPTRFQRISLLQGPGALGVRTFAIADISGDGRLDLIAACNGQLIYLRQGESALNPFTWVSDVISGSSGAGLGQWTDVALVQLDGLFAPDLVACNGDPGRLIWFRSPQFPLNGNGWTPIGIDTATRAGASALVIEDIDRDNLPDVMSAAAGESQATLAWYRNPGLTVDPTQPWLRFAVTGFAQPTRIAVADVDRDGRSDVIACSPTQRRIGWFQQPVDLTEPAWQGYVLADFSTNTPVDLIAADVEVNGQPDVVVATADVGGLRWFTPINSVQSRWVENNLADFSLNVNRIAMGDIDRDGRIDVAAALLGATASEDTVAWFLNPEF